MAAFAAYYECIYGWKDDIILEILWQLLLHIMSVFMGDKYMCIWIIYRQLLLHYQCVLVYFMGGLLQHYVLRFGVFYERYYMCERWDAY